MGLVVATTVALGLWLVLWSLGAKALDASLLSITIILVAAGVKMAAAQLIQRD